MCYRLNSVVRSQSTICFKFIPHTCQLQYTYLSRLSSFFTFFFYRVTRYRDRFEEKLAQRVYMCVILLQHSVGIGKKKNAIQTISKLTIRHEP